MSTTTHGTRNRIAGRESATVDPALLDVEAVAELLSCSTRTVRRMADAGQMPRPVKLASLCRWRARTGDPQTGVNDWLQAGCPRCDRRGR
jgi:predicted DNA-binding transcriptional regulator AlpA